MYSTIINYFIEIWTYLDISTEISLYENWIRFCENDKVDSLIRNKPQNQVYLIFIKCVVRPIPIIPTGIFWVEGGRILKHMGAKGINWELG